MEKRVLKQQWWWWWYSCCCSSSSGSAADRRIREAIPRCWRQRTGPRAPDSTQGISCDADSGVVQVWRSREQPSMSQLPADDAACAKVSQWRRQWHMTLSVHGHAWANAVKVNVWRESLATTFANALSPFLSLMNICKVSINEMCWGLPSLGHFSGQRSTTVVPKLFPGCWSPPLLGASVTFLVPPPLPHHKYWPFCAANSKQCISIIKINPN